MFENFPAFRVPVCVPLWEVNPITGLLSPVMFAGCENFRLSFLRAWEEDARSGEFRSGKIFSMLVLAVRSVMDDLKESVSFSLLSYETITLKEGSAAVRARHRMLFLILCPRLLRQVICSCHDTRAGNLTSFPPRSQTRLAMFFLSGFPLLVCAVSFSL